MYKNASEVTGRGKLKRKAVVYQRQLPNKSLTQNKRT
jgi:hypothetical protein